MSDQYQRPYFDRFTPTTTAPNPGVGQLFSQGPVYPGFVSRSTVDYSTPMAMSKAFKQDGNKAELDALFQTTDPKIVTPAQVAIMSQWRAPY